MFAVTAALFLQAAPALPTEEPKIRWTEPVLHTTAVLLTMRVSEAFLWPEPFANFHGSSLATHYREAYTMPPLFDTSARPFEWDHDRWQINVVGHGLFGSELHYRARSCGFSVLGALAFSTVASATWEYGLEASGVRPSAIDLVYTPLAGLALGEARYWIFRATSGIENKTWRTVARVVVDPFGEIERAIGAGC